MIMLLRQFTLHFVYELPIITAAQRYNKLLCTNSCYERNTSKQFEINFFSPCFIIKMTSL